MFIDRYFRVFSGFDRLKTRSMTAFFENFIKFHEKHEKRRFSHFSVIERTETCQVVKSDWLASCFGNAETF